MGNYCCCCFGSKDPHHKGRDAITSPPPPFLRMDDDWADEIWYDALDTHDEDDERHLAEEPTFDVTAAELQTLKTELAKAYPADWQYMDDAYLTSVASKPYSKDMTRRRPLEYTLEKLMHVMEWRREMQVSEMETWIDACHAGDPSSELPKDTAVKALKMVESLNNNHMYWHGMTRCGRPILWVRVDRKFWYPNVQAEVNALVCMADVGIRHGMPAGVTDFCAISHAHKPPPPHPPCVFQMLRGLVKGYPDRMWLLISAPVSSMIEFCMNLILPHLPGRLAHKFSFYNLEHVQEKLETLLLNGKDDIPTFFGGPANHDVYYPDVKSCPNRGQGSLKFDWYGMKRRLQEQKAAFEKNQKLQNNGN